MSDEQLFDQAFDEYVDLLHGVTFPRATCPNLRGEDQLARPHLKAVTPSE